MKYKITVSIAGIATEVIIAKSRTQAARIAHVVAWTNGYTGDEHHFYLSPRTTSVAWIKSDRIFSVTVTRWSQS